MEPYQIVNRQTKFQGRIVDVFVDEITLPNGKTAMREIVQHHYEGVGILAIDADGGMFFVRQYRHPLGKHVLEIPAGIMNPGENPADCAARELEEEIGYRAGKLTFLCAANNAIGVSNDKICIYIAEDLTKTAQNLDADEFLSVEKYSPAQCREMIARGEIHDSKTILAVWGWMTSTKISH